uniref:tRNA(His) guanylyltransferase n=1 Tax=Rhipicephalus appendiculatus TaxID=34631 RepID=A0A131YW61_RHIAP
MTHFAQSLCVVAIRKARTLSFLRRALLQTDFPPASNVGKMAKSKFEYVRLFEADDKCLPNCWIVVRIDGKAFHKFSDVHGFEKPNDKRALDLMTRCAERVMEEYSEICVSYGQSDEYSFVFRKNAELYNRRASKIMTNVCSLFTSSYLFYWPQFFTCPVQYPPSFDGRVVLYPSDANLRDYLSWRQADCHINNLYNTAFWALVQQGGLTTKQAEERLRGTVSSDKNEILFQEFQTNYNNLPALYRKGTVVIREPINDKSSGDGSKVSKNRKHAKAFRITALNVDIIQKDFWSKYPHLLAE